MFSEGYLGDYIDVLFHTLFSWLGLPVPGVDRRHPSRLPNRVGEEGWCHKNMRRWLSSLPCFSLLDRPHRGAGQHGIWKIRVFYKDRFLCPAVSAELAGETISLRDITRVRDQRRRELSSILHHRQRVVDSLLQLKKGITPKEIHTKAAVAPLSKVLI